MISKEQIRGWLLENCSYLLGTQYEKVIYDCIQDLASIESKCKPEPKAGEYWLIKDVHDHERVVYFDGKMLTDGPACNDAYLDVTLIGKMERVEE